MARIPDEIVERLKGDVSLVRLVESEGISLRGTGDNLLGKCPGHEDGTASLVVSPAKNLWHCMAGCGAGSVIDWLMWRRGVSFRHAVELLRTDALALPAATSRGRRAALQSVIAKTGEDREVLRQVVSYYHQTLKESPEALRYLEERGLVHPELVDHFQLGYANRTLGYRVKAKADRERLQRLGVIRDSGHEHLAGSLVVPLLDEDGEVLGMYGRKITPTHQLRKGTALHLYLPGPREVVFNAKALAVSTTVILCEALIDALTFWCAGFRAVTTSYGTEGFTAHHLAAFKRHGTGQVLIAYDRDEAGDRAAEKLAEKLLAEGVECFRVLFPKGMDANEYARKVTPADKSLGTLLRHATWMGRGAAPAVNAELEASNVPSLVTTVTSPVKPDEPAAVVVVDDGAPNDGPNTVELPPPTPEAAAASEVDPLPLAAKEEAPRRAAADPSGAKTDELSLEFGDRRYRVRGLARNLAHGALRVNVLVARGDLLHVDTLDLCSARQRGAFVKQAAAELQVHEDTIKREVGQVLFRLEQLQDDLIKKTLEPKTKEAVLSDAEQAAALELLRDPRLVDRILADFEACGIVGEEVNKLTGYVAVVSRLLDRPIAILVQSSSAAGKSALMEAQLAFCPEEAVVQVSAMTGQALFYMGETDLKHKVLAISEEQGASRASYALKLLQSEGRLTIASTGKDPASGRLVTHEYRVEGPVMIFLTTTAVEIDEELLNRCIVLTVDEDREQTRAIHRRQRARQTLEGLLESQARPALLKVHQDAQRMLRPILVANPFAPRLTFLDDRTRTRRDHEKYLTLIRAIALLHQYQREVKTTTWRGTVVPYIEVTLDDIVLANSLADQVLGRSLDELAPQTRRLLMALHDMGAEVCSAQKLADRREWRFTRRQVRESTGWSQTQLRVHLDRLVDLEYVTAHHGKQGQGYEYELLYDGQGKDGRPFLIGLADVERLRTGAGTTATSRGEETTSRADDPHFAGRWRGESGPVSGGWRSGPSEPSSATVAADLAPNASEGPETLLGSSDLYPGAVVVPVSGNGHGGALPPPS